MIFIAIVFGQQSKSGLELEESTIQGVLTVKLAKADSVVLQPGFTTRFFVTSKKSTKRSKKEDEPQSYQITGFGKEEKE